MRNYLFATLLVAATTLLATGVRAVFPVPDLQVLYLMTVVLTAVWIGRGPAIAAAVLGVVAYDFFFVPPFLTLAVSDVQYFLSFAMMFGIGILVSELTARLRRQEQESRLREERTAVLYALSRDLGTAEDATAVALVVARHASELFGAEAFLLQGDREGALSVLSEVPLGTTLDPKEQAVAKWAFEHGRLAGAGTDTLPGSLALCLPLQVREASIGVLVLRSRAQTAFGVEQRALLEAFGRQAAFAFDRARLAEEARAAALRAKTEEMRSSLLSAVSHDLRTPLAAITGAASCLRDEPSFASGTRMELLETICDEAERLERLVTNLLDMTRLESGAVVLKKEWVPLEEMIGSALTRLEEKLEQRAVRLDLPGSLPLLCVDAVLFEQVFINLIENAIKYTPTGSPMEVAARVEQQKVVVEVRDRGPGLCPGSEVRIFDKFYRGPHVGIGGVGLGLSICKGVVEAHDGTIEAETREGGGAVFRVTLPVLPSPTSVAAEAAL